MCIGALIGGGVDLGVQLFNNGGDLHKVNWVEVGVSAAVGATGVGPGGVIANATKSVVVNVAVNAVASGAVSAIAAEAQNGLQEALTPGKFAPVDPLRAAVIGGVTGGAGAAIGEVIEGGTKALANARYNNMTLAQKLIANSNAFIRDPNARSIYEDMYRVGFVASTLVSNSGAGVPPEVTNKLPSSSELP
jgi:hypothetical protein